MEKKTRYCFKLRTNFSKSTNFLKGVPFYMFSFKLEAIFTIYRKINNKLFNLIVCDKFC